MSTEYTITVMLALAVLDYLAAGFALSYGKRVPGMGFFVLGWVINAILLVFNWAVCGHPPFGNMYHVLVVLGLCFLPAYLVLALREKLTWLAAVFAFTSVVPLLGLFFMTPDMAWRRMPALQSPWFVPHVVTYMIGYSLCAVAFILAIMGMIEARRLDENPERYQEAGYHVLRLAFPFMTFGLLSGALWAEEAWGTYWSWDPKETWSLITWLLYAIYFHCRRQAGLKRFAVIVQILAFLALLTTFLLVNLLPKLGSILHSYA